MDWITDSQLTTNYSITRLPNYQIQDSITPM